MGVEIIASFKNGEESRVVAFSELYGLRQNICSLLLLWDTNSYYVNCEEGVVMVNGGRRIRSDKFRDSEILYRKRNAMTYSMASNEDTSPEKVVSWIIGLQKAGEMVALEIKNEGVTWGWITHL